MPNTIYIEPDEEITSVIGKLTSAASAQVILVVPKEATILQGLVNLKLLKMEAKKLSKEIAIVTSDKVGRNLLTQIDIPVFDNIKSAEPVILPQRPQPAAQEEIVIDNSKPEALPKDVKIHHFQERQMPEPKPVVEVMPAAKAGEKPLSKNKSKLIIEIVATGVILILIALGLFAFLPYTVLNIKVSVKPFEKEVAVTLDKNAAGVSIDSATAPASLIAKELEQSKDFQATGKKEVGQKAKGTITISNKTGEPVSLGSSSKVKAASGLIFVTSSAVNVPAATAKIDSSGNVSVTAGKADVVVEASEPGTKYNLGPTSFTILDISAAKQANVFGQSSASLAGGTTEQITIVSSDDIENAKKSLQNDIFNALKDAIKNENPNLQILEDVFSQDVESFQSSVPSGTQTDNFKATMKSKAKALAFEEKDFRQVVMEKAKVDIPADSMMVVSAQDEITTTLKSKDIEAGQMTVAGKLLSKIGPKIDTEKIRAQAVNKTFSNLAPQIKSVAGVEDVKIQTMPENWLKRTPLLKYNIKVKLEYD